MIVTLCETIEISASQIRLLRCLENNPIYSTIGKRQDCVDKLRDKGLARESISNEVRITAKGLRVLESVKLASKIVRF